MTVAELIRDAKKHCMSEKIPVIMCAAVRLSRGKKYKSLNFSVTDIHEEIKKQAKS